MVQIVPQLGTAKLLRSTRALSLPIMDQEREAAAPIPKTTTDLGGLFGILRRNLWKIALATLAGTLISLAYLIIATPVYTATASLFVDPRTRKVISEETVPGGMGTDLALVESQVSIITSDTVLKRVVGALNLAEDPEFAPASGMGLITRIKSIFVPQPPSVVDQTAQAINTLNQNIKVKRAQKTYVVDIDVSASSAVKAQRLAQAVVDAYLADQTAAKTSEAKRANGLIDARLGELREQVRIAETRVDDFKKANRIITSEGGMVAEQQLTRLNSELINARAVEAESQARQEQITSALKSGAGPEVFARCHSLRPDPKIT